GHHRAADQTGELAALIGLARGLFGAVTRPGALARLGQLVARGGHRLTQRLDTRKGRVERDLRLLGREIDQRLIDAGDRGQRALDLPAARRAMHPANGLDEVGRLLRHHLPRKRANTSSSSSIFCWRSLFEPVRTASATHDSICRPSRSFSTCSSAPCTAETWSRMSTQYASPSIIR